METIKEKQELTTKEELDIVPPPGTMETIQENKPALTDKDKEETKEDDPLTRLLMKNTGLTATSNPTESIGRRNVVHRRAQSTTLFSILDSPTNLRHRVRSLSLAEAPSLDKYFPGSHLLDSGNRFVDHAAGQIYLSLWLLPPRPLRDRLSQQIAKLAMRYSPQGSSAPFVPHVTIVGSIACGRLREATELGKELQRGLKGSGGVPCRFDPTKSCHAMYHNDHDNNGTTTKRRLVWSQSCIAIMERSDEFMNLLELSRHCLKLPPGEWMFVRSCWSVIILVAVCSGCVFGFVGYLLSCWSCWY